MDKYEYRLKAEQIDKLVKKKDYVTAAKIADTIDWRRVRNLNMLYVVSEIYEKTDRYGECMEILDIAYDRAPVGRMLLYRMTEVCTKMHNFEEAISLYREFVKVAPHDQSRYILKYQIYRERGSSLEDQIKILNEYKSHEYQEKWAYELAERYDEAGLSRECVRECDELILWFSEGEYVSKALKLKQKYEPLTREQQQKYNCQVKGLVPSVSEDHFEDTAVQEFSTDRFNTMNLQAELAGNLDELLQEDATIELPSLDLGAERALEEPEEHPEEERIIDLPDLGMDVKIDFSFPEEEKPDLREDATIELPDLGLEGEAESDSEEEILKADLREDATIELPDLGLEGETESAPEEREEIPEPDLREDATIELPDLGLEGEAEPVSEEREEIPEPDLKEDATIELPDLGLEGEAEPASEEWEEIPELSLKENTTIELPDFGLEGKTEPAPEEQEEIPEPDVKEDTTIELPDLGLEGETESAPEEREEIPEPDVKEDTTIELPDFGLEEETEPEVPEEASKTGAERGTGMGRAEAVTEEDPEEAPSQNSGPISIDEILTEWQNKKKETEAILKAESEKARIRKEKVRQETAELMKLIAGESSEIPEEVRRILNEVDKAEKEEEEPVVTEDDLPPDLDEEDGEDEFVVEDLEDTGELAGGAKRVRASSGSSMNMIQELERSLAAEVSEMAVNAGHLTKEQAHLFAYFTSVKGMSKQLSVLFKDNPRTGKPNSSSGNLIITGEQGNGKTTLAIDIVKALQKQGRIEGKRLAKISGQKLNTKDIYEIMKKLKGGALIIESAGGLSDATLMALSLAMESDTGGLLVILEDSAEEVEQLFHRNKNFASKFDHTIDIPVFTNDELVSFGKSYAQELGYTFDEFGVLALYDQIGSRQTNDHMVMVAEVKDIIDGAIEHAGKGSIRHLLEKVTKKSVDEFGNRLLREADFVE